MFLKHKMSDPLGGSSQFKYYPYLLALSNPKQIAGAGAFPPLHPPLRRCAAPLPLRGALSPSGAGQKSQNTPGAGQKEVEPDTPPLEPKWGVQGL